MERDTALKYYVHLLDNLTAQMDTLRTVFTNSDPSALSRIFIPLAHARTYMVTNFLDKNIFFTDSVTRSFSTHIDALMAPLEIRLPKSEIL